MLIEHSRLIPSCAGRWSRHLALLGLLVTTCPAVAQPVGEINLRELSRKGRTIQGWLKSSVAPENQPIVDQFFQRYYFPEMTKSDPESLSNLGGMRSDLFDRYIWPAQPAVQKRLTDEAFNFAMAVVSGKKYPLDAAQTRASYSQPVKYNAALILGLLDEKYATRNDNTLKPLGKANNSLCLIVKYSADQQRFPNNLELAALIGLERHTRSFDTLDRSAQGATALALLAAINQQEYRPGATRDVQYWMKLLAAQGLANMKVAGKDGVFVEAIAGLAADEKADLITRTSAAALLANIDMASLPEKVKSQVVGAVKGLACSVASAERRSAQDFIEVQGMRGLPPTQLNGAERFRQSDTGWVYERRGLVAQLDRLSAGLNAVGKIAGDDAATIDSIRKAVLGTIDTANKENIDFDVIDSIRSMASDVDRLAGCNVKPPAKEAEEEVLLEAVAAPAEPAQ